MDRQSPWLYWVTILLICNRVDHQQSARCGNARVWPVEQIRKRAALFVRVDAVTRCSTGLLSSAVEMEMGGEALREQIHPRKIG